MLFQNQEIGKIQINKRKAIHTVAIWVTETPGHLVCFNFDQFDFNQIFLPH